MTNNNIKAFMDSLDKKERELINEYDKFKKRTEDVPLTEFLFGREVTPSKDFIRLEINALVSKTKTLEGWISSLPEKEYKAVAQMVQKHIDDQCKLNALLNLLVQRGIFVCKEDGKK